MLLGRESNGVNDNTLNQRSLLFMLGSLALITLPHAWHMPMALSVFFAVLWLWRTLGIWYQRWLPNRWQLLLLTVVGMALMVSQQHGLLGRDAGTSLFVTALGLKLLEIQGKRDVYLIVYLAFVVAATQFLYEESILMAGYFLLVCALLLTTLITQTAQQASTLSAFKTAAVLMLQALPIATVVFVLFPRVEAPRWMWLQEDTKGLTGLTDTLEPGSISELSLSDELVFRVRFGGELPPPHLRYWRGPVYARTDGVRWSASERHEPKVSAPVFDGLAYRYTLLMEPQKEAWVFALDMAESYDASLRRTGWYQLVSNKRPGERAEYQITSRTVYNTGELTEAEREENLQLPQAASQRQLQLVEKLQGFADGPERFISNLLNHFRQEKFYYTLTPPLMPNDPIDTFLFEARSGFCSHYATAFVYLLRIAKIPARVVGGYQGGEINKVGGFLEVRQADAHAWAEAWLENKGWVRFDPTAAIAPERIERGVNVDRQIASGAVSFAPVVLDAAAINWLKRGRQLWQSLDYNWQRWVINYRGANQSQFLQRLGIDNLRQLTAWLVGGVLLFILPLSWWLLRRPKAYKAPALLYYERFCAKLAKAGVPIELGEGPRDFALRAQQHCPALAVNIAQISALFIRLQYQADARAEDLQQLKNRVDAFRV